ncbi:polysaccharide pyruvyl transferase family protein [Methylophaga sp.]|uniref:polysaccharide pyruvyl transferase family protein n=1 Tax=Methylophaga sp. TaxID=2024840 RepID=UPI0027234B7F|nr:polysaccharide pyruvyl transferase family protein [Methylophaga sp.]MDO8825449.1 polysaccharide pyruvyl transferase family protein [Methylophaga sp.]
MKILIDNSGYELKNIGDISMLIVALSRINSLLPEAKVSVFTVNPEKLKSIYPNAEPVEINGRKLWKQKRNLFGGIFRLIPNKLTPYVEFFEDWLKFKHPNLVYPIIHYRLQKRGFETQPIRKYLDKVIESDYVIATGGGFVTDCFSSHAENVLNTLELAQNMGKPTAMLGQGLGPLTNLRLENIAKRVFPKLLMIGLREGVYSKDLAIKLGGKKECIRVTGDDAIEITLKHRDTIKSSKKIGINLRIADYSSLNKESIFQIKETLLKTSQILSADLSPIPISSHSEDSDIKALSQLLNKSLKISDYETVESVLKEISSCRIVVTGSYHAGVFALSLGIPVVAIVASEYYKQKFDGLKGQFKYAFHIVDVQSAESVGDILSKSIEAAWNNVLSERSLLIDSANSQIEKSKNIYKSFLV